MYQFQRDSRVYMKGEGEDDRCKTTGRSSSRPSSRSPMQELSGNHMRSSSHHRSSQGINGTSNGTSPTHHQHHSQTKSLKDSQHRAVSSELGELKAPGDSRTKTQMARAFQETQEVHKSADSKAGLQTIKTQRISKKTTTITRGENEKLEDNSNFREILLRWAQKTTDGYPGCNVTDLTTSWRDGLAYNAIIHRNRPDLLDYRGCRKKTSRDNLDQAFTVGERDLGVARLLEPEDVDVPQPDEKSMITYLAQLYELFPNPPERNPLLDEEKIRRIDEYKELASKLLRWIKDSTCKLEDRKWPKSIPELKKLKDENHRWRAEEVPPKQHDKQRLATVARDIYKMAQDVNVRIPDELHMDNVEYHWDRMLAAHKARDQALDDEIARAERLKALLQKLLEDIDKTNGRLDGIERDIGEEERRVARLESLKEAEAMPSKIKRISEELADCGIKIEGIKRLADDFVREAGRNSPDAIMIREKVSALDSRYKQLLAKLNKLHDLYERAVKRLRDMEDASRKLMRQREAEAKLRLKLDAMKRRLDELERRIDNMGPIARDRETLQKQLKELREFDQDLNKCKVDLNDLIKLAEDMIADDLIVDPPRLRADLQLLKDQLARIEDKAARRLRDFEEATRRAEANKKAEEELHLKLDGIRKELENLDRRIDAMAPPARDLETLKRQREELRDFESDFDNVKRKLADLILLAEDLMRNDVISDPARLRSGIKGLKDLEAKIADKVARRKKLLQDAISKAELQRAEEEKMRLKLDAMKKELDELERRLDNMAPVASEISALQQQLAEMNDFVQQINKTKGNLNELIKLGEDLIRSDLIADPADLRKNLKQLKDQMERIEGKAAKRIADIQDAMRRVEASDAIGDIAKWLEKARKVLADEENVRGDLDTVNALIEQHKSFEEELKARQPTMNEIRKMESELSSSSPRNAAIIKDELNSLSNQWRQVENLSREKTVKFNEALRMAETLHAQVHSLLEWLADAEVKLRFTGMMPEDEVGTKAELVEHEKLTREMGGKEQMKNSTLSLAKDILNKCHPDAEPVIKHWINIVESRWDEIDQWAKQRGNKLAEHLKALKQVLETVEQLIGYLTKHEGRLAAEENNSKQHPAAEKPQQLDAMMDEHSGFMEDLKRKEPDVDGVVKIFAAKSGSSTSKTILTTTTVKPQASAGAASSGRSSSASGRVSATSNRSQTPTSAGRTSYASYRDEYPDVKQPRAKIMLDKWRSVWQLSLDKMTRLKERVEQVNELERLENFDLDEWRRRFLRWLNASRGRVTDFFRSLDDNNDGRVPVDAFINGVLRHRFESSRLELERVASAMDKNNDGIIDSKEFLDSLRPDKPITDDELIQDEVQRQVAMCTCRLRFKVYHVGEGRYRFGESQKLRLVRILRSTVMVRVGGGWEPLISFLQKNDPCRAKGRTNVELREQFILPEGASQVMAAFRSRLAKDPSSVPTLGPITKIREKTDRSMPMSQRVGGSPSDYYSETDSTSRAPRSRGPSAAAGRLTPAGSSHLGTSRTTSRPSSRQSSDLSFVDQNVSANISANNNNNNNNNPN